MANIRKRSGDAFAQVDNYLIALKMLGIPSGEVPTLDALVSANDSAKIFFNTSKKAFQVYVDGVWIDTEVNLSDYYNKQEVDNLVSGAIASLIWKDDVAEFADLATEYPDAIEGWTSVVNDENKIYRFDGTDWIPIGDITIPMATASVDGKMSKEDFVKLRDIEAEATKNRSDAYLLNRENFEGQDPISSIEGASAAPNNSIPAKKGDGTYGWVVYNEPKSVSIRRADGKVIYFDNLITAIYDSLEDDRQDDVIEIHRDTYVDEYIMLYGNRTLQMNGFSLYLTTPGAIVGIESPSKIVNGYKIIKNSSGEAISTQGTGIGEIVIQASIENLEGSAIEDNAATVHIFGDVISKNDCITNNYAGGSFIIKGNITSLEGTAASSGMIVYGNVITKSLNSPSARVGPYHDLLVYGNILIDNPLSEAEAVHLDNAAQGGHAHVKIAGSIIPALGPAVTRALGFSNPLSVTFLGFASYKGEIASDIPIIVEVPFPEDLEGVQDIIAGSNISIDKTDPKNPIISSTGGGTGLTPEQEAKLENTPDNTIEELADKVDKEEGKGLSSNDFTSIEKDKLGNIESEAQKNVQSDWNQEDSNSDDFIKNKPTLFSGSYNDLEDVPSSFPSTIEDVSGLENELGGLQDQITINENKLEYVLNFPPDVINYDFKETIDIKINSVKIEPESGQTVDLGGYILGETLEAYTVLSISVNKGGIIELIGERV